MKSLPARLAITILVPVAIYFLSGWVLIPGADQLAAGIREPSQALQLSRSLSVFGLGVMPAMSAFGIIAFLVPRLRRLRHGNPEGRAKLDRAARALTMVLAGFQAFGIAMSLASLAASSTVAGAAPPMWVVIASPPCRSAMMPSSGPGVPDPRTPPRVPGCALGPIAPGPLVA